MGVLTDVEVLFMKYPCQNDISIEESYAVFNEFQIQHDYHKRVE